jgi:hypothetical protein
MIKKIRSKRNNAAASGETMADGGSANDLPPGADTASAVHGVGAVESPGPAANKDAKQLRSATNDNRTERSFQLRLALIGGVFAIVAALVGALVSGAFTSPGGGASSSSSSSSSSPPSSLSTAPLVPGDDSAFMRDVTYPDYSKVQVNMRFTKIWELRDTGIVRWTGRYLAALGPSSGRCTYPARVSIPATDPGATVDISVSVTAASSPGLCYVTWRMVTSSGMLYFPGDIGIWFKVDVVATKNSG